MSVSMTEITSADIRRAAMDLLARREHTLRELSDKLQKKFSRQLNKDTSAFQIGDCPNQNFEPAIIDSSELQCMIDRELVRLNEERLQSDERFVESFVNSRRNKGYGPQRIRRELIHKNVAESLVEQFVSESDEQWVSLARTVYLKKYGEDVPRDFREKAKRYGFMQRRGFPTWMVDALN